MNSLIFLKRIYRILSYCKTSLLSIKKLCFDKSYTKAESYFPEYADRRKTTFSIFLDQLKWIVKYSHVNEFYFLYGFDIRGLRNQDDYIEYRRNFMYKRNRPNNKSPFSPIVVLRDKALFGIVAESFGINTPKNIGIIQNDEIYILKKEKRSYDLESWLKQNPFNAFLKKIDGECADGVYHLVNQIAMGGGKNYL